MVPILLQVISLQKKAKIFNTETTEQTEIKKLKSNSQSLPSLFALLSPVNLLGCAQGLRLVRVGF
jgi:hypothetical protein